MLTSNTSKKNINFPVSFFVHDVEYTGKLKMNNPPDELPRKFYFFRTKITLPRHWDTPVFSILNRFRLFHLNPENNNHIMYWFRRPFEITFYWSLKNILFFIVLNSVLNITYKICKVKSKSIGFITINITSKCITVIELHVLWVSMKDDNISSKWQMSF